MPEIKSVYLDNAATTPLDPEVFEAMKPYLTDHFGNPSSIHAHGRKVRAAIEQARKKVAELLNAAPSEIFFTSSGTEADNMAIKCTVKAKDIKHVITSPVEHHAVLHPIEELVGQGKVKMHFVQLDGNGQIIMESLEDILKRHPRAMVSLMHGNNEIGNITDLEKVADLCAEYGAIFHSDTVQTVGHYPIDLQQLKVHFIAGSAHKFHGPKGIGFLYINPDIKIPPYITGGAQERNMRGGTENVAGIVGLAKALEISCREMDNQQKHIQELKDYMIEKFRTKVPGVQFNGNIGEPDKNLYKVLNVSLPPSEDNDMLLFNLDILKISASAGSACSSGSNVGSHVLSQIVKDRQRGAVRFSFSKYNTKEEIDYVVDQLAKFYIHKTKNPAI